MARNGLRRSARRIDPGQSRSRQPEYGPGFLGARLLLDVVPNLGGGEVLAAEQIPEGQDRFTTEKEFAKLSADWPLNRFPEVWNTFAGVVPFGDLKPVKKFTDRKTAVSRIWKAIQALTPTPAPEAAPVAPKKAKEATAKDAAPAKPKARKAAKDAPEAAASRPAREGSKKAIVLELIRRADGASLPEIMSATDWQAHSVRGFISGSLGKKMGLTVESFKRPDGARAYKLAQ